MSEDRRLKRIPRSDIVFERLVDLNNTADRVRFQQIYEDNFPDYEHKPMQAFYNWRDLLRIYIARDIGQCVGFATTCLLDNYPVAFLSYLAVYPAYQNQGIGSRLLTHTLAQLAVDTDAEALLWEVEPEQPQAEHLNNRRIRFYERHGARVITEVKDYRMPSTIEDHPPIPMRLMWADIGGRTPTLTPSRVRQWVAAMFDTLYADEPELREMALADLPDR